MSQDPPVVDCREWRCQCHDLYQDACAEITALRKDLAGSHVLSMRLEVVAAERDRYRKALKEIQYGADCTCGDVRPHGVGCAVKIAMLVLEI